MTNLGILLNQFGEVVEETVLGSQEVKLIVSLLSVHQVGQKLTPIPGHKLRCQLHHISEIFIIGIM